MQNEINKEMAHVSHEINTLNSHIKTSRIEIEISSDLSESQKKTMEEANTRMDKRLVDLQSQHTDLTRRKRTVDDKVSEYQRHIRQFDKARQVVKDKERDLEPGTPSTSYIHNNTNTYVIIKHIPHNLGECVMYRDFVNQVR